MANLIALCVGNVLSAFPKAFVFVETCFHPSMLSIFENISFCAGKGSALTFWGAGLSCPLDRVLIVFMMSCVLSDVLMCLTCKSREVF